VLSVAGAIRLAEAQLHDGVLTAVAGALIATGEAPAKLNPYIRPLMNAIQVQAERARRRPPSAGTGCTGRCHLFYHPDALA